MEGGWSKTDAPPLPAVAAAWSGVGGVGGRASLDAGGRVPVCQSESYDRPLEVHQPLRKDTSEMQY